MANATSRGFRWAYLQETVFGTTDTAALKLLRNVGGGLTVNKQFQESDELHVDEVPDQILVSVDGTIRIPVELSYSALDDLLEAIFGNTWSTNVLTVGSTKIGVTFEKQFTDIGKYLACAGCLVTGLTITAQDGGKITGVITAMPMTLPSTMASATVGNPTTPVAAPTNDIMDPKLSMQLIQEGGSLDLKAIGVTQWTIEYTRDAIRQPGMGSYNMYGQDPSRFRAKGSVSLYLPDGTLYDKMMANTATSMALTVGGSSSKKYAFLHSKVRIAGGPQEVTKDTPVIQTYQWFGYKDATNTTAKITRTP